MGFLRSLEIAFLPIAFYLALDICWKGGCFPQQYDRFQVCSSYAFEKLRPE